MDVVVAQAVVDTLLERVATIAEREISAILGVETRLKELQTRLARVRGLLRHADTRGIRDSKGTLLKELRDVLYDADDVVDTCMFDGGRLLKLELRVRSPFSSISSCFRCLKYRHQIAADIQKINLRIDEIKDDRPITAPVGEVVRRGSSFTRETAPTEANTNIVGPQIETNTQKLISDILMEGGEAAQCAIFAITGMGGIGKTTLASKVYNDERITSNFSKRVWLHISKDYSPSDLFRRIIRTLGGKVESDESKAELETKLNEVLEGPKRLFLVLDDVWSADVWFKSLRGPLTSRRAECKILVTTRHDGVARSLLARHRYPVAKMDDESCWNLLCKELYADGDRNDHEEIRELKGIGLEIVQKCDGLPLAVKAVAGVLRGKERQVNVWRGVVDSEIWSMQEIKDEVPRALYLSYQDLSPELKQCFLYCCLLSANGLMGKEDLMRYWIDEGIIMEDAAEDCYTELMQRNLLQPDPMFLNAEVWSTMHDLLQSLGQFLMEGESICIREGDRRVPATSPITKLRRLVMLPNAGETATYETLKMADVQAEPKHLRALFVYDLVFNVIEDSLFERLCHLRILMLSNSKIEQLPPSIGNLLHLRHLNLYGTNITKIPSSIGRLANLQTLRAAGCQSLRQLPTTVTRLHNLRFLEVEETPLTHVPKGIGQLKNLNYITGMVIGHSGGSTSKEEEKGGCFHIKKEEEGCDLGELEHLSKLRVLGVHMLHRSCDTSIVSSVLADKSFLRTLLLSERVCEGDEPTNLTKEQILATQDIYDALSPPSSLQQLLIVNFPGEVFPGWLMSQSLGDSFPHMTALMMDNAKSCTRLPPHLCRLPRLNHLRIKGADAISVIGTEFFTSRPGSIPFPKLESLWFSKMPNWEEWQEWSSRCLQEDDQIMARYGSSNNTLLPNLRRLVLHDCPKLKALPKCLSLATNLMTLRVLKCSQLREIRNLPMLDGTLEVDGCETLQRLSKLASLKRLTIVNCPKLDVVENLDELQELLIETSADDLPRWLSSAVDRPEPLFERIYLRCNLKLLEACLKGGPNWHIICQIPNVEVEDISSSGKYMRYSRDDPHSYQTNV